MRKTFLFALTLFSFLTYGQGPDGDIPKFKFSGIVIDQETQQPLEYATVSIRNSQKTNRLQGGITGSDGKFNIEVFPGIYDITIDYIGFENFEKKGVVVRSNKDWGKVNLYISSTSLEGVEVMAEKTEVEIRLDKRIYNVGKDLTVRGGSVADVLDNVPSVTVDLDGNVALRGNDNV